jgi:hypothetical protein
MVDETLPIPPPKAARPTLPFSPKRQGAGPAIHRQTVAPRLETGTQAVDIAQSAGRAIPFGAEASPGGSIDPRNIDLSLFPLEKFASISGRLAKGESRETVLGEHRLSEGLYRLLATAWAKRFDADPAVRARFAALAKEQSR